MSGASNAAPSAKSGGEYRIGRYRVRARLGKGGMGVVYLGRDEALDRDVAIKTLRSGGSSDDESRGRFEIEAKAAARLQHPNIVTVFELGEDRGLPYIAMELLGGDDLETLLRSGEKLSQTERLDVVIQTLRGLDFAHSHQIVHRDIKPSNIRVLDDGGVKILDFGIAKVESTSVTRAGMMVGTPYYMSPEHIRGGVLDGRTDVFAVGVILHELFAGNRPFTADDPTRVLYRIVNEPHPRLPQGATGSITKALQRVIDKALEKEADARFGSAALMADDLERVRARYPGAVLGADDTATLAQAKKGLNAHRLDLALIESVEAIARSNPESAEAQRLRRLLKRTPSQPRSVEETAQFPELDATFGKANSSGEETIASHRTINGRAETILQSGGQEAASASSRPPPSNALIYGAVAATVAAGTLAALLYLNRSGAFAPAQPRPSPAVTEIFVPGDGPAPAKPAASVAPARPGGASRPGLPAVAIMPKTTLQINSQPAGAAVSLDRKAIGVTPIKVDVVASAPHSITLSLPGYKSKEIRVDLPIPAAVEATLTAEGPPASLIVESTYPITVAVAGRVIATEKMGITATVPAGTFEVVLEAAAVFLKQRETIHIEAGGAATLKAPLTGKIGVRASPDNCKVFVDGTFVDYPPILDRVIAAGNHIVAFEWPDGSRAEEKIVIQAGKPSYVQGRKP